ncbi:ribonuclease-III-like-domain-containing protein [Gymnopilus junonius]|uniref:Ribonuclease-III-like-domain-containing protein n=1 Tax=Gymnopilus junonius TaxID=109634 RepID=A0A9P5TSZ4_GYMJU|nr:ribonuclease-III-like-domain-containing protein [Gymnopilus junonius]
MNQLFSPLQFPPELAQRILTHASHHLARRGHNAAYSFIGRRVLNAYFLMFLNSSQHLTPQHDIEQIASSALHTNLLGEHVAHAWGVGRVLVWAPSAPSEFAAKKLDLQTLRSAGLYKVQGEAVQAMVGGIYQQYGGSVAHRLFHTRILPRLRVKGGLPYPFFGDAQRFCDAMGGEQGSLLLEDSKRPKVEA